MVGQQLQRDGSHQRLQTLLHVGQLDHLVGNLRDCIVALRHQRDHPTLTGLDLLDVRQHLLIHRIVRGNHHHGHV